MNKNNFSRRDILKAAILLPVILSSCKKTQSDPSLPSSGLAKKEEILEHCPTIALSDAEKNIRQSLKYIDKTQIIGRTCDNCKLYTKPINNNLCGGCPIVPGPIHPKGHCISWIALM